MDSTSEIFSHAEKLASLGQRKDAESAWTTCIERITREVQNTDNEEELSSLKDKLAVAYNNRGYLRYLMVDFDGAVDDYTAGLQNNDKLPVLFYNRGLIHYRLGRFDDAIQDQEKCLQLDKDFKSAAQCLEQSIADRDSKQFIPNWT